MVIPIEGLIPLGLMYNSKSVFNIVMKMNQFILSFYRLVAGKKQVCAFVLLLLLSSGSSCKKFLNVDGLEAMSGNNFWQSESDVESYTIGVYGLMRQALLNSVIYPMAGDWRFGIWIANNYSPGGRRGFIDQAAQNNVKGIFNADQNWGNNQKFWVVADAIPLTWKYLYQTIAAANILYTKIDEVPDPAFSDVSRKKYKAEAVYLRCLSYFFLSRFFGDVPYYTNAYNQDPLPRTSLVTVFKSCLADIRAVKDDLPWTYKDPANVGVRAMRGGALVMMMEMDMWVSTFDAATNAQGYWEDVDTLGSELINDNGGVYGLIPIEQYPTIFRGKSKEALIEISKNANYGESNYASNNRNFEFGTYTTHNPVGSVQSSTSSAGSSSYPNGSFMQTLYPDGSVDKRKTLWYNANISAGNGSFEFWKYLDFSLPSGTYNSPGLLITRYADAYLLRAEALANLGDDDKAITMLNAIRTRAGATLYTSGEDQTLSDAIWNERVKEFMLEGHYSFDLIRTKRLLDPKFCIWPMSLEAFNNGAWTWPIPATSVANGFSNNPYMTQYPYWKLLGF